MNELTKELIETNLESLRKLRVPDKAKGAVLVLPGEYEQEKIAVPKGFRLLLIVNFKPVVQQVSERMTAIYYEEPSPKPIDYREELKTTKEAVRKFLSKIK